MLCCLVVDIALLVLKGMFVVNISMTKQPQLTVVHFVSVISSSTRSRSILGGGGGGIFNSSFYLPRTFVIILILETNYDFLRGSF